MLIFLILESRNAEVCSLKFAGIRLMVGGASLCGSEPSSDAELSMPKVK